MACHQMFSTCYALPVTCLLTFPFLVTYLFPINLVWHVFICIVVVAIAYIVL